MLNDVKIPNLVEDDQRLSKTLKRKLLKIELIRHTSSLLLKRLFIGQILINTEIVRICQIQQS